MKRTQIINLFIAKYNYQSYLEIGVFNPNNNFNKINVKQKIGIDPNPNANPTIIITSDEFFKTNKDQFDFIFIDGLHHAEQVYKDVKNSLKIISPNGTIMCHDLTPHSKHSQEVPYTGQEAWYGDCWKTWIKLRQEITDKEMYCIDTDCGCGIIRSSPNPNIPLEPNLELTYENFQLNKEKWLNLISVNTFINFKMTN